MIGCRSSAWTGRIPGVEAVRAHPRTVEETNVFIEQWQLRARFAAGLSAMYGREVPAYTTLVEVSHEVNHDVVARDGDLSSPGGLDRVTAERHGAIRVGTPAELRDVATIFAGFGMHPVGYYDLRDVAAKPVPVISTAFRPVDPVELERNPFRVFTSVLATGDERFFDDDLRGELEAFLARRSLFGPELLALASRAERDGGLDGTAAEEFVTRAVSAFELTREPVERSWYERLERISAVAADIGGVASTHINHMTPRVLDIDELHRRMTARGIAMIDAIQGPPRWAGPDVLLRQTSFRALAEPRVIREADGSVTTGSLRVRFGEVEARGIALTPAGRQAYDTLMAQGDELAADPDVHDPAEACAQLWWENFPRTTSALAEAGYAYVTYQVTTQVSTNAGAVTQAVPGDGRDARDEGIGTLTALVAAGRVSAEPIVYEDFLPRSAAGIFQSNLDGQTSRSEGAAGHRYDAEWMAGALRRDVHDPYDLYAAQQRASAERALVVLAQHG